MSKPKEPLQVPYAEWRCRRDYLTYVNNCKPGEPSEQYLWDEQSGWQKVPCKKGSNYAIQWVGEPKAD